mmetsp:Transcript_20970/g.18596  ORF Transcript_20970/g.18596 Transcript_20970/m.18596 type:complete len:125 (-) Transcript_20970:34-408(-)
MNHINRLHEGDKIKHFQKKGINDLNFIGMINDCSNDILNFNQISFLPNSLIHKKDKVHKLKAFEGGSSMQTYTPRQTMTSRTSGYRSETVTSLIRKYKSSSKIHRRNITMKSVERKNSGKRHIL